MDKAIIDVFTHKAVSGWMSSHLASAPLLLIIDGAVMELAYSIHPRPDLPPGFSGFRALLPPSVDLCLQNLVSRNVTFRLGEIDVSLWPPALVLFGFENFADRDKKIAINALRRLEGGRYENAFESLNDIVVKENGLLFLHQGSNDISDQYRMEKSEAAARAERIAALFRARQEFCARNGVKFVQALIPEKSTVFKELYDPFVTGPTPLYRAVLTKLAGETWLADLYPALNSRDCWPAGGTHLSLKGSQAATLKLLETLGLKADITWGCSYKKYMTADALRILTRTHGAEYMEMIDLIDDIFYQGQPIRAELVFRSDPAHGRHDGKIRKWKASNAPFKAKVICFGNSFFEQGYACMNLSWMFARLFSEFTFIWTAGLDAELLKKERPDICICQTIERFLVGLPEWASDWKDLAPDAK